MLHLTITTCQAPLAEPMVAAVAGYLGDALGATLTLRTDLPWQERQLALDAGAIDIGWICGPPYVQRAAMAAPPIELLAAPIQAAPRYAGLPRYFSDVVVRRESRYASFADLRAARWAYNERTSHSGWYLFRAHLAALGETERYFAALTESGAHAESLRMVCAGEADASAIDSTVLELALRERPALARQIRVVATLGPSPMPPWVVRRSLDAAIKVRLRSALTAMHNDLLGRALLAAHQLAGFAAVADSDYDPIRRMMELAGRL